MTCFGKVLKKLSEKFHTGGERGYQWLACYQNIGQLAFDVI